MDVSVLELEVEGRLIDWKAHPEVVLGRPSEIRDHRLSVE